MFTNDPRAADVSLLTIRYICNNIHDTGLRRNLKQYVNRILKTAEIDWLCEQNRYEEAEILHFASGPNHRFIIGDWEKSNGFHHVFGKYRNEEIYVMVPYKPLNIEAVQAAVEEIEEFKSSVDEFANNHAKDSKWNACPRMHIADLENGHAYELYTFNLNEL